MITSMMLGRLYVRCMELEKKMSEVLMMPEMVIFKRKRDLDVLPLTQSALEIHITRANYPAKMVLSRPCTNIMDLKNKPLNQLICGKKVQIDLKLFGSAC